MVCTLPYCTFASFISENRRAADVRSTLVLHFIVQYPKEQLLRVG